MAAIAMAMMFAGYSVMLYAYCLIRGYNVSPKQLFSSTWPPVEAS